MQRKLVPCAVKLIRYISFQELRIFVQTDSSQHTENTQLSTVDVIVLTKHQYQETRQMTWIKIKSKDMTSHTSWLAEQCSHISFPSQFKDCQMPANKSCIGTITRTRRKRIHKQNVYKIDLAERFKNLVTGSNVL